MSFRILIKNGKLINEGKQEEKDILINPPFIERIDRDITLPAAKIIDAAGKIVIPGLIDDQVHFREPGLTHKGDISSESRAAVAGGITSFMDMPNTNPQTLTQDLLEAKYSIGAAKSWANYSFYMGVSNDNLAEVVKTDPKNVCGVKVFLGASTGNMLVDNPAALEKLFSEAPVLVAAHCEHEPTIRENIESARKIHGENIPVQMHPLIRSDQACYLSSSFAADLAKRLGTRLHILHLSTAGELSLFRNDIPLKDKKITAEVCIHHLWFDDRDYNDKGAMIKWNPAIKTAADRDALFNAVLDGRIDIIATDHAPHTLEEKSNTYFKCPSGGPLVQHSFAAMMEFGNQGKITIEKIVEKMCHNPALLFQIYGRGFLKEGYYADIAIAGTSNPWTVNKANILYKCGWSPFEGQQFNTSVTHTFVSGKLVYEEGKFRDFQPGMRLAFSR
jgi:dihydroorotase